MPGAEAAYPDDNDRYPTDEAEHARILGWCLESFDAAKRVREPQSERWARYYRMYRSYVPRQKGDWRSKVFLPICFYVVETVIPRLVAQLPKMLVTPVGEEDVEPAKLMEQLLEWAADRGNLYLELVKSYKSSLKYGTGILKVYHEREVRTKKVQVEVLEPVMQTPMLPLTDPETGEPMMDLNGEPMMDETEEPVMDPETGEPLEQPTGEMRTETEEIVIYDGPKAEAVDIFNFWPAPEATSVEDASYVIQRVFRDDKYVKRMLDEGTYKLPPGKQFADLWTSEKGDLARVQSDVGVNSQDPTRKRAEILEFWTDDEVVTVLNQIAIVRVADNPFDHGEKPFVRVVDHFQEHEFWGIGEIEPIEGLQSEMNAIVNQRIDNVRLVLDRMYAFDPDNIHDLRDLAVRPGGAIRVKSKDIAARDVIQPLDIPDVTGSSYNEVAEAERMSEKVSGVNAYTAGGQDSTGLNDTATGVSLISEAGNTRFSMKVRMGELTGLVPLARQMGSILQQFAEDEMVIRIAGPRGQFEWQNIAADGIQGGFDFQIETESSTVTESVRKEQSMSLFQLALASFRSDGSPIFNVDELAEDVLESWNIKDLEGYLAPAPMAQPMVDPTTGMPIEEPMQDPNALPPEGLQAVQ